VKTRNHTEDFEIASVRRAAPALAGVGPIDILKIDTEGHEYRILHDLADRLGDVSFIFLEIHANPDRVRIDALLEPFFDLFYARCDMINRYKVAYVNRRHEGAGRVQAPTCPALSA